MAHELKPLNTKWNAEDQKWELLDPTDSDLQLPFKFTSPEDLLKIIRENETYKKFSRRAQGNIEAIKEGKTETQQKEGGYIPQTISGTLTALSGLGSSISAYLVLTAKSPKAIEQLGAFSSTALLEAQQNLTSYLTKFNQTSFTLNELRNITQTIAGNILDIGLKDSNQQIDEWNKDNVASQKDYLNSLAIASVVMGSFFIVGTMAYYYTNFRATNREKKQKQLYEIMQKLLQRFPAVQKEIIKKEQVVQGLINLFNSSDPPLYFDQKPLVQQESFDFSQKENESDQVVVNIGYQYSLRDVILIELDKKKDLNAYEEVEGILKILGKFGSETQLDKVDKTVFIFLEFTLRSQNPPDNQDQSFNNINELINVFGLKNTIQGLILICLPKEKLLIINKLLTLLEKCKINTNIDFKNPKLSILAHIVACLQDKSSYDLDNIYQNLKSLTEDQQQSLERYIKNHFIKNKSIEDFEKLIAFISNPFQLNNTVNDKDYKARIAQKLIELNAGGSDKNLAKADGDPHYWYSIMDGYRLLQSIRKEKLNYYYKIKDKQEEQPFRFKEREEYSCYRENRERIFITDPYYIGTFEESLKDDIDIIVGKHMQRKITSWRIMPSLLIIAVLSFNHWQVVRVEIDYENRKVSILFDDPYGEDRFLKTSRQQISDAIKTSIISLFQKMEKGDEKNISFEEHEKKLVQQSSRNSWDCGPIAFSNIFDYSNKALKNEYFAASNSDNFYSTSAKTIENLRKNHASACSKYELIEATQPKMKKTIASLNANIEAKLKIEDESLNDWLKKIGELDSEWIPQVFEELGQLAPNGKYEPIHYELAYFSVQLKITESKAQLKNLVPSDASSLNLKKKIVT